MTVYRIFRRPGPAQGPGRRGPAAVPVAVTVTEAGGLTFIWPGGSTAPNRATRLRPGSPGPASELLGHNMASCDQQILAVHKILCEQQHAKFELFK